MAHIHGDDVRMRMILLGGLFETIEALSPHPKESRHLEKNPQQLLCLEQNSCYTFKHARLPPSPWLPTECASADCLTTARSCEAIVRSTGPVAEGHEESVAGGLGVRTVFSAHIYSVTHTHTYG